MKTANVVFFSHVLELRRGLYFRCQSQIDKEAGYPEAEGGAEEEVVRTEQPPEDDEERRPLVLL